MHLEVCAHHIISMKFFGTTSGTLRKSCADVERRIALLDSDKLDIEREGLAGKRMICIERHA